MPIGATLVSILIVAGFYGMIWLRFSHPEIKEDSSLTLMFGAMIAGFTQVANYWLGSSRSSATKDDAMQATAAKLADNVVGPPSPIASTIIHPDSGKDAVRVVDATKGGS